MTAAKRTLKSHAKWLLSEFRRAGISHPDIKGGR